MPDTIHINGLTFWLIYMVLFFAICGGCWLVDWLRDR